MFHTLRFAQFFLCPLFDESCKDREVNAVDSEHEKNVMNDAWRLFQLEKATGNPKHPFSKFGTGLSAAALMHQFSLTSLKPWPFCPVLYFTVQDRRLQNSLEFGSDKWLLYHCSSLVFLSFFLFKKIIVYLLASGLSCIMHEDLLLQQTDSLVVVSQL